MSFSALPASAAWSHGGARAGFEVAFFVSDALGGDVSGCTTAVEDGHPWIVDYRIRLDTVGQTRSALVRAGSGGQERTASLEHDGAGHWEVDGRPAAHLDGCRDVDLESSALTNAFPVRRLALEIGQASPAPAAYVRAATLQVLRLEQHYTRVEDGMSATRYDYSAPEFAFSCRLDYDTAGLVVTYPGIARRVH